ncbi:methylmalonyl-CoA mutase family protein [Marinitenerispora sediminis]|uniref:methylmalonyl-CoA mutase n=1 Tax=Marinitenerispora sediminis TaxID=1931232 RepID=A0A368T595_9ACTN|nr:methylmalonyl-CoA mutase family protein [Marinitenerispora sediminis]RCV57283.1 methylmalonyl-CoA mutase [Marinitenerispora sediminis]RCV58256.1 methylmalonyl-CoA mutase [Marinitenerispora sediminis]RCV58477.1 methylmalonyl-CoA mutase [Marinitenerispora sediminis]
MNMPENGAPMPAPPDLAAGFPEATAEQWRRLVVQVLRRSGTEVGPDEEAPELRLAHTTYDGITVRPLYVPGDDLDSGVPGLPPFTRGGRPEGSVVHGWDVRQRHAHPDPAVSRRAVLADLENGVTSLWLVAGPAGVPADALADVLADVHLDLAPVFLEAGAGYATAADALLAAYAERGVAPSAVRGGLGADPLGTAARTGEPVDVAAAAAFAAGCAAAHPDLLLMTADATPYHDAGGSEAQELGAAVATGVAYLRALTAAGLPLAEAAGRLEFRLAATADQFLTIAKLRAARAMWHRVTEVCGLPVPHRAMRLHAVTSAAMMTRRDPYVNMLRTTLAGFAAGVGGADAVTVRPFDDALGLPDDFARRIARNTQSLLLEEAHVARVADPAGGSFYVERLTAELYAKGWEYLQRVEAAGGMAAALASGLVAADLHQVWERRRGDLAHRRTPVTGVSEFPDLTEPVVGREPAPQAPAAAAALPRHRYAEEYEALRDRSDAHLAATGGRPRVFLATLGPVAVHTARAAFAANLFRSGGIEPVSVGALDGPDAAAAAFSGSGARIACICSSDDVYADQAVGTAAALRAAGAERVLIAGRPDASCAQAVDDAVSTGCDALSLLTELADFLGVAA